MITMEFSMSAANVAQSLLVSEKQMAYAMSNSINATMKLIQKAERDRVHQDMTVRKTTFIERQIAIIKPFARPDRLSATVSIGHKPRLQLANFQEGGTQEPVLGKNIAVPITGGARPSKASGVPRPMWLSSMHLRKTGNSVRGYTEMGGVYVISDVGVFLRQGKSTQMLYRFLKTEAIERRLHFYQVAVKVANDNMPGLLREQVVESMNHTMAKGVSALTRAAIVGTGVAKIMSQFGISAEPADEDEGPDDN